MPHQSHQFNSSIKYNQLCAPSFYSILIQHKFPAATRNRTKAQKTKQHNDLNNQTTTTTNNRVNHGREKSH